MDILDKLIQFAQIKGSVDAQCVFGKQWYVRHETEPDCGLVHIVTSGSGYIRLDGVSEPELMNTGDVIFFPRSAGHILSSSPECDNCGDKPSVSHNGLFQIKHTGREDGISFFCARFRYAEHADIMNNLPEKILLNLSHPSLQPLVSMLQYESRRPQLGSSAVVNSLSAILLVLLVRTYLDSGENVTLGGLLNAWRDRRLRGVVQAVIECPEYAWNVDEMSAAAHISRAQLMRLFKQQIGISPHAFVNHIRLQQAAVLLKQSSDSVLSVALKVGFQSETHFGKAFKKQFGVSPGVYRKGSNTDAPPADDPLYFI